MAGFMKKSQASYILLVLFAAMLVTGLLWGGFSKVLAEGIVICLDCIGLI